MILSCEDCGVSLIAWPAPAMLPETHVLCVECLAKKAFKQDGPPSLPVAPASTHSVQTVGDSSPEAGPRFLCPECKTLKTWHLRRPYWTGAVCQDCFRGPTATAGGTR